MKLVLANEMAAYVEPHLPSDIQVVHLNQGQLDGDASDAEVYFHYWSENPFFEQMLENLPSLRWLHTESAGINHLLTPALLSRDLLMTNSAGGHAIPISEFVLTYMLSYAKRLPKLNAAQSHCSWLPELEVQSWQVQELMDATLLIIGAGGIGQAVAQRASVFGMRVWGSCYHPRLIPGFEQVVGADEWRQLLPQADYVLTSTPLTPQTRHLLDADALRSMRSSAYLINVARGEVIDEEALIQALREGWIAGAALDTFCTEPLPSDSPLWSLPNVTITPHCTALSRRMKQRIAELFLKNLALYQAGMPLGNVVDKTAGY